MAYYTSLASSPNLSERFRISKSTSTVRMRFRKRRMSHRYKKNIILIYEINVCHVSYRTA